jgi:hypothetical protein
MTAAHEAPATGPHFLTAGTLLTGYTKNANGKTIHVQCNDPIWFILLL